MKASFWIVTWKRGLPLFFVAIEGDGFGLGVARAREEIVERCDSGDYGSERGRNLRVAHVGDVVVAVGEREIVNLGAERVADLRGGGADVDDHSAFVGLIDGEAARGEPALDGVEILLVDAVAGGELFGSEPVMVVGGRGIVHRVDVIAEVGLGLRVALEEDEDVIETEVVGDGAAVVLGEGGGGSGVAGERDEFGFVDSFGDLWAWGLGAEGRVWLARASRGGYSDSACGGLLSAGKNLSGAPRTVRGHSHFMARWAVSRRGWLTVG